MISATKPRRVLVRPKPYYMTIPVLTDEASEALSRAGRSHGEKYGPDYWKRIRRGERPSQDGPRPDGDPGELSQPVQPPPKPEPLSNAVRAKRAKYPPGSQRQKLIREYGQDYFRVIRKGIRPSLNPSHPRTGKRLKPI
jgi:hypothetical protein